MVFNANSRAFPLTLIEWRPFDKNTLKGFATVQLGALKITDVTLHSRDGKFWCGFPARPMLSHDGVAMRDRRGRQRYSQILEWATPEAAARFRQAVFDAVERDYPDALTAK